MNIQMYSGNMMYDMYPGTPMDHLISQHEQTSAILPNFYATPQGGTGQMVFGQLQAFDVMNLDRYRPGVFFNALA
ncbi:MAG: hypothetical protein CMO66_01020 [Verrucomicrobiales bacterium]|nr:hypothetical protein [Verrucomicrobiales bacterium]